MTLSAAFYVILLCVATAIALFLFAWVWANRRQAAPGAGTFSLLMASVALWALTGIWEAAAASVELKVLASKVQYLAVVCVAPLWFLTALVYGRSGRRAGRRLLPLLWVVPAVVVAFVWTNEAHGLIWPSVTPLPGSKEALLVYAYGPMAWISAGYSYLLFVAGTAVILAAAFRAQRIFRLQAAALIFGALFPLAASLVYLFQFTPSAVDWTPVAFAVSGVIVAWGLFRYGLLNVLPVGQSVLMTGLKDGVVILDDLGRVLGLNPAASGLTGWTGDAVGRHPSELRPEATGCARLGSAVLAEPGERVVFCPDCRRFIEVRTSDFADRRNRRIGRLVVLRDITAQKDVEAALRASLEEKEVLLKEVHHRVKNNMQIVSSLLSHQSRLVRDPQVLGIFKESQNRIRSIALVHEKLYRSSDFSRIDFAEYILALAPHLVQTAGLERGQVRFAPDLEPLEVTITDAVPLGLIVNELVTNALKHAFPGGRRGELRVELARSADGRRKLVVADNGVGMPEGFDIRTAETLGMQIVLMLVGQIGGEIAVGAGSGARFEILFP